jgi:hypothetical protein
MDLCLTGTVLKSPSQHRARFWEASAGGWPPTLRLRFGGAANFLDCDLSKSPAPQQIPQTRRTSRVVAWLCTLRQRRPVWLKCEKNGLVPVADTRVPRTHDRYLAKTRGPGTVHIGTVPGRHLELRARDRFILLLPCCLCPADTRDPRGPETAPQNPRTNRRDFPPPDEGEPFGA